MLLPRIGALLVLGGFAYGLATYMRMAYVVGIEGFWSWAWMLVFLAPMTILGIGASILFLKRDPRGHLLTKPFVIVTLITGLLAIGNAPPVGSFVDDFQTASIQRGIEVPPFEASQDMTPAEYAEKLAGDFKLQGALIAMGTAVAFFVMARRGTIRKPKPKAQASGQAAGAV